MMREDTNMELRQRSNELPDVLPILGNGLKLDFSLCLLFSPFRTLFYGTAHSQGAC